MPKAKILRGAIVGNLTLRLFHALPQEQAGWAVKAWADLLMEGKEPESIPANAIGTWMAILTECEALGRLSTMRADSGRIGGDTASKGKQTGSKGKQTEANGLFGVAKGSNGVAKGSNGVAKGSNGVANPSKGKQTGSKTKQNPQEKEVEEEKEEEKESLLACDTRARTREEQQPPPDPATLGFPQYSPIAAEVAALVPNDIRNRLSAVWQAAAMRGLSATDLSKWANHRNRQTWRTAQGRGATITADTVGSDLAVWASNQSNYKGTNNGNNGQSNHTGIAATAYKDDPFS